LVERCRPSQLRNAAKQQHELDRNQVCSHFWVVPVSPPAMIACDGRGERCLTVSPLLLVVLLALFLFLSHRICAMDHLYLAVLVKNRV
jgi:hypothetical protein